MLTEKLNGKTKTYSYDNNGNMLSRIVGVGVPDDPSFTQEFDVLNRMTEYTKDGVISTYTYGVDNMRSSKTVDGITTKHVWSMGNIVADITNDETTKYTYGLNLIKSDTYGWSVYDGHGSVVALTDNSGTVTKNYQYDAYGNEMGTPDPTDQNPFKYSSQYTDYESGYQYLRNRYYDPQIGRFINQDPIKDGSNWHAYCGNDPINMVDPSGLWFTPDLNGDGKIDMADQKIADQKYYVRKAKAEDAERARAAEAYQNSKRNKSAKTATTTVPSTTTTTTPSTTAQTTTSTTSQKDPATYIIYDKDQKVNAMVMKEQIEKEIDIHIEATMVGSSSQFETAWNNIGNDYNAQNVIVNIHGQPDKIFAGNQSVNIGNLNSISVSNNLILLSCQTGQMSTTNNVASRLASKNYVGGMVIAPDSYNNRWDDGTLSVNWQNSKESVMSNGYIGYFNGGRQMLNMGRDDYIWDSLVSNPANRVTITQLINAGRP